MKKNVTLTCFDLSSQSENLTYEDDFYGEIKKILDESKSVLSRIRYLSDSNEEGESHFISNYKISDTGIFCTFLYMENGRGINISDKFMNSKSFDIEEVESDPDSSIGGHLKESTYFLMTKNNIILKNSRNISYEDISLYLNFLLETYSDKYAGKEHPLFVKYHIQKDFDVTKIKGFELVEGYKINKDSLFATVSKNIDFTDIVKATGIKDLKPEDIFSASIVFKIKKIPKNDKKENERIMQTIFDSFNTENVKFKGKGDVTLQINNAKMTKEVSVDFDIKSKQPDKEELKKQMYDLLNEVINENNT